MRVEVVMVPLHFRELTGNLAPSWPLILRDCRWVEGFDWVALVDGERVRVACQWSCASILRDCRWVEVLMIDFSFV